VEADRIREGWQAGRDAWPDVDLAEEDFASYVRERAQPSQASPRWADLYLACACARGVAKALRAFDVLLAKAVTSADVRQHVRHKLLVAEAGKQPKIAEYVGRGPLRTWLRITATRASLDLAASAKREVPVENDALELIVGAGRDPELDFFKQRYAKEFRAAFGDAFAALGARDRTLLRYAFGDGLGIDAIGTIYGVHRATAARWVVVAHEELVQGLRKTMMQRLDLKPDEYASILRLIESRIEVSFERLLKM
jgi:RNA polymerase sigma-70 factor (ECF subfamily)